MRTFRSRLILCFLGCMCVPLAVSFWGYAYYSARAERESTSRILDRSHNELLRAFQLSRDFFNLEQRSVSFFETGESAYLARVERQLALVTAGLTAVQVRLQDSPALSRQALELRAGLRAYRDQLQALAGLLRRRGFMDAGAAGAMRARIRELEGKISAPEHIVQLLTLRRYEKDYIIRDQPVYVQRLKEESRRLIASVRVDERLSSAERAELVAMVHAYVNDFLELVDIDQRIGLRSGAGRFGALAAAEANLNRAQQRLADDFQRHKVEAFMAMEQQLLMAIGCLGAFALVLSVLLSRSLTKPLSDLSRQIRDFVKNDFAVALEARSSAVERQDEVGRIARDFNVLESQIQHYISSLKEQRQLADEANREKSLFLANMSHEIRTPLNGVVGMAQLLETTELDAEQRSCAEIINHSSGNLLAIVNDVLDFSKIEAGEAGLEERPFELLAEFRRCVDSFAPQAETKGLALVVEAPDAESLWVSGDSAKWCQVLNNLLGNAVKFTTEGEVRVSLAVTGEADGPLVSVSVADTGVGIAPQALPHVFEAFKQEDSSTTRRFGGTGLGLSISHQLVALMGGELTVRSVPDVGSVFSFEVPLRLAAAPASAPKAQARQGLKVLLAEDNELNQRIAAKMLDRLGCSVTIAGNGRSAVEACRKSSFDLVLMDVQMPIMDGIEAARIIRAEGGTDALPIVALTANVTQEDRRACREAGMSEFLSKPLRFDSLNEVLANATSAGARSAPG